MTMLIYLKIITTCNILGCPTFKEIIKRHTEEENKRMINESFLTLFIVVIFLKK